ncbi:MAG: hypothetical protein AAF368_19185 [Planctomycetota bacterium]
MASFRARFFELFRSGFTEMSFWKRWMLRGAVLLLVGGGAVTAYSAVAGGAEAAEGEGFSTTAWTSGLGCLLGFAVGAAMRIALKLALLVGVVVAAGLWGVSALNLVDLPWESFSDVQTGVAAYIHEQSGSLHDLLTSYLPSSAASGLGLFSGVTQRPDTDPDD